MRKSKDQKMTQAPPGLSFLTLSLLRVAEERAALGAGGGMWEVRLGTRALLLDETDGETGAAAEERMGHLARASMERAGRSSRERLEGRDWRGHRPERGQE